MPLFVHLAGRRRSATRRPSASGAAIRAALSPRYLPDDIIAVSGIPHTRTGKKLEVPVKRLLQGHRLEDVVDPGSVDDVAVLAQIRDTARRPAPSVHRSPNRSGRCWTPTAARRASGSPSCPRRTATPWLRMTVSPEGANGHGIAHGGLVFTLADTRLRLRGQQPDTGLGDRRGEHRVPQRRARRRGAGRRGAGPARGRAPVPRRRDRPLRRIA